MNIDEQYSYQIILQDNLQQLGNFIADKKKELNFVIPKMTLNRRDILGLREKILSMTPDERSKQDVFRNGWDDVWRHIIKT